jgi:hydroxymethylbilane synthase
VELKLPDTRIGTRASRLALNQTRIFIDSVDWNDMGKEIVEVKSHGDIDLTSSLSEIGGTGVFTEKLNNMILDGEIDLAIHSAKDIPSSLNEEIEICMAIEGHNYRDFLVGTYNIKNIKASGRIGTSSPRRMAEIKYIRPDIEVVNLRGNVETRLRKKTESNLDGIILAKAGLDRLQLNPEGFELPEDIFVPAPGQGIIAVTALKDSEISKYLKSYSETWSMERLNAERRCMKIMGASCTVPFGILILPEEKGYRYYICITNEKGINYTDGFSDDLSKIEGICRELYER